MSVNKYDLKRLRRDKKLKQEELSEIIGILRPRLSRVENYRDNLTYDQEQRLRNHFKDIDVFLYQPKGESGLIIEHKEKIEKFEAEIEWYRARIEHLESVVAALLTKISGQNQG